MIKQTRYYRQTKEYQIKANKNAKYKLAKKGKWTYSGTKLRIDEDSMGESENETPMAELFNWKCSESGELCSIYSEHGNESHDSIIKGPGQFPNCRSIGYMLIGIRTKAICGRCRELDSIRELTRLGGYFTIPIPIPIGYEIGEPRIRGVSREIDNGIQYIDSSNNECYEYSGIRQWEFQRDYQYSELDPIEREINSFNWEELANEYIAK